MYDKTLTHNTKKQVPRWTANQLQRSSFGNSRSGIPYYSRKDKQNLHHATNSTAIEEKIQKASGLAGSLIEGVAESSTGTLGSIFSKIKNAYNDINSSDPDSKNQLIMKKAVQGLLSGGFFVFATKSTIDFFSGLMSGNHNSLLKLVDTSIRWIMGFLCFNSFRGKGFKLNSLNQILTGLGVSAFMGQLTGINVGKNNTLRNISKATGMEATLQKMTDWFNLVPKYNPQGIGLKT